jgi:ABC-type lipoprotein export system ATPase subunit
MTVSPSRLDVANLVRHYQTADGVLRVLNGVSLQAEPGETLAIAGPSGSGKSTLLNIIGTLDKPTSGTVYLGDTEVTALEGPALAAFRAARVGFVFQDHHLLPQLTALENVLLPGLSGYGPHDAPHHARRLLDRMGVSHRSDAFPAQMSGGERQRVAAARALINGARLLLCDEPTGNLDRDTGANLVSLLLELAETEGATVLMVTHNLEQAQRFRRQLALRDGTLTRIPAEGAS